MASTRKTKAAATDALWQVNPAVKTVLHMEMPGKRRGLLHAAFQGEGWRAIRVNAEGNDAEVVTTLPALAAVPDAAVDAVWLSRYLDLLPYHHVQPALLSCLRVLRQGGQVMLAVSDMMRVAEAILEGQIEDHCFAVSQQKITPLDILYGHRAAHEQGTGLVPRTGFTAMSIGNHLRAAGFATIKVQRDGVSLVAAGYKLPQDDKEKILILDSSSPETDPLDRPPQLPFKKPD